MVSARDLAILEALGARFVCLNGSARNATTLSVSCDDRTFADWAQRRDVRGVLVRPDRFIAARLSPGRNLDVLAPFAAALTAADPRVAA
jgi:3-(3-hydroxy-phenyl)propionate hydroxylase